MNKEGQFYLVAAMIIIVILLGVVGVVNYSISDSNTRVYDIKEELKFEGDSVLEHGIYNEFDENSMQDLIKGFTEDYTQYIGTGETIYFIFGNMDKIILLTYTELTTGTVSLSIGETTQILKLTEGGVYQTEIDTEGKTSVKVIIDEIEYDFELKPGQNFYFVISDNDGEDINVAKGGQDG